MVQTLGTAIITQTPDLAPADKRLYAIRDLTATVESVELITASILSKKLASGLDALVIDVKVGNGAMMQTLADARRLANSLQAVANGGGVKTRAVISDMNQVLGSTAGNALEVSETLDFLSGHHRESRLNQVVRQLAEQMLLLGGVVQTSEQAQQKISQALDCGKAAEIFEKMLVMLGGPADIFANRKALPRAKIIRPVTALSSGYLDAMDTRQLGLIVVELGGGRTALRQTIDPSVGLNQIRPLGEFIEKGEPLAMVHAASDDAAERAISRYRQSISISEQQPSVKPLFYALN
jgi:thymidine phosphorylase